MAISRNIMVRIFSTGSAVGYLSQDLIKLLNRWSITHGRERLIYHVTPSPYPDYADGSKSYVYWLDLSVLPENSP